MEINNIFDLVELYSKNEIFYESVEYDETSTRVDFIYKFLSKFQIYIDINCIDGGKLKHR